MTLNYSSLSTQEVVDLCGKKLKYDEVKLIIKVLKKSKGQSNQDIEDVKQSAYP